MTLRTRYTMNELYPSGKSCPHPGNKPGSLNNHRAVITENRTITKTSANLKQFGTHMDNDRPLSICTYYTLLYNLDAYKYT